MTCWVRPQISVLVTRISGFYSSQRTTGVDDATGYRRFDLCDYLVGYPFMALPIGLRGGGIDPRRGPNSNLRKKALWVSGIAVVVTAIVVTLMLVGDSVHLCPDWELVGL